MKVIDLINRRLGQGKVMPSACGFDRKAWDMNKNFKSPRYFTNWSDL